MTQPNGQGRNWLEEWQPIQFNSKPGDRKRIDEIQRNIRIFIRGWLAEYNAKSATNISVSQIRFRRTSKSPLAYKVSAFLNPPPQKKSVPHLASAVEAPHDDSFYLKAAWPRTSTLAKRVGSHLIPSEPPPPK